MLHFTKMQALGNDFVFIDARQQPFTLTPADICALADRHTGIGFDQLLCLMPASTSGTDGHYRVFNADGQEVAQCGNGARCVAHYLYHQGKSREEPVVLTSQSGVITVTPYASEPPTHAHLGNVGYYRAALAIPSFTAETIPLQTSNDMTAQFKAGWLTWPYGGNVYEGGVVSVGNPHWVIRVTDGDTTVLETLGTALQAKASLFPEGVNVSWIRVDTPHQLTVDVYERGAGLTQACGSAAAAAAVVAISQGWCDNPVRVIMPGGYLMVDWLGIGKPVFVTGTAVLVFQGEIKQ